ncbi:MAG: hypothetical protein ACFFCS_28440, partial [Candidatus Hodarchaeota archaeon]
MAILLGTIILFCTSITPLILPDFQLNVSETPLDSEKHVMAFYYTWYANTTDYTNSAVGILDQGNHWYWLAGGHTPWDINWSYIQLFSLPQNETEVDSNSFTWNKTWLESAHFPEWGNFDSADPAKMRADFTRAANIGVDTFITTWWGYNHYIDRNFNNCLNYAFFLENNLSIANIPNFTIYFEHARGEGFWPEEYGEH